MILYEQQSSFTDSKNHMSFWGKIIGAILGIFIAGPFGFFLGLFIGHLFDMGLHRQWQFFQFNVKQASQIQQEFFNATFQVMGHIAKADGQVTQAEIAAARSVMQRMGLNEQMRLKAIDLFNQGKQSDFNLNETLSRLIQACQGQHVLLRMFVELQSQAASAEGTLSPAKQAILQSICTRLGFAPLNFVFEDLFGFKQNYQQSYGRAGYQGGFQQPRRSGLSLSEAYKLLEVSESASDVDVKKAYRKQMSQNHPDKLVSKGLPEEMIKLATEKTQKIKAAYDQIAAARGIS